ncbi:phosphate uptake regulator PhoU [Natronorarus salvus]|uniref:phosphate uptake regulator PhoU n=1 Tax=Natronorarus salvus TaxID=3117733 RepID=UPI002F25FC7D
MEVRKVQITGGSTFTVSLPKEWASGLGIEAGTELAFFQDADSLIATPNDNTPEEVATVDISAVEETELVSRVITLYVNGFPEIVLEAEPITPAQRRAVRSVTNGLVGFEVSTETDGRIVLRDFLDSSELSIHNTVMRMRLIALSMLADVIEALIDGDASLARDVIGRDDDVDRLWYVTSRMFRAALRDPRAAAKLDVDRGTCFDYRSCARQIERIADHAVKIGHHVGELDDLPEGIDEPFRALEAEATAVVENAMDAFLVDDDERATELASETLARAQEIDGHARAIDDHLREIDPVDAQHLGLVVDSLTRIGDYGANVAETALQKAAPSPSASGRRYRPPASIE